MSTDPGSNAPTGNFFGDIVRDAELPDRLIGTKAGEYVIRRRIGMGGMGLVYEAVQPQIGRKVAVKILRPDIAQSPEQLEGLLSEARAANTIHHRGIIDIFGFGELPGIGQYLVMEYLAGKPLSFLIHEQAPMPPEEVIELLDSVLDALGAAHSAGVVHRDLKPSNIFVVEEPTGLRYTKLLDFGLAKRVPTAHGANNSTADVVVGTPEYMPPEQAARQAVGPRSDLYALGIVAFEMLTGRRPISGKTSIETAYHQMHAVPALPSDFVPVPPEIEVLVMQLLAKEPFARPSSASVVQAELKRIAATLHRRKTAVGPVSLPGLEPPTEQIPQTNLSPTAHEPTAGGNHGEASRIPEVVLSEASASALGLCILGSPPEANFAAIAISAARRAPDDDPSRTINLDGEPLVVPLQVARDPRHMLSWLRTTLAASGYASDVVVPEHFDKIFAPELLSEADRTTIAAAQSVVRIFERMDWRNRVPGSEFLAASSDPGKK